MKDFASCFSDHAVKVSDTSCSGSSSSGGGGNSSVVDNAGTAVVTAVTSLFLARLSTKKELLITVTWSKGQVVALPTLSVAIGDQNAINCRKTKGSRALVSGSWSVELHWDTSSANYRSGPEPTDGFFLVIVVDSKIALSIGDLSEECTKRLEAAPAAQCSMVCRREKVIGCTPHTTRARFRAGGSEHEIAIRYGWDAKESELSVALDNKRVVHVSSLRWNFRGNQTIFVDGSPVDMLWDVHATAAVFMFRARSSLESRLWLEEETRGASGFSLLIQVSKRH